MEIRYARVSDAQACLEIYTPYVLNTAITFELEVPTLKAFETRIQKISTEFPYLVACENGEILGYAYASRYRERKAYDWVVELSIYVNKNAQAQGLGTALYHTLLSALTKLHYQRAYACITYPNDQSIQFHEKLGFEPIGQFKKSGYKFEKWFDILWMELALQESEKPAQILLLSALTEREKNALIQ